MKSTVKHIDRCLSCLACMTTCPSGVQLTCTLWTMPANISSRPIRGLCSSGFFVGSCPKNPALSGAVPAGASGGGAKIRGGPFRGLLPDPRLRAMLEMAPKHIPPVSRNDDPQVFSPQGARKMRVALMTGCAQRALNTDINDATIRLLRRLGCEVVIAEGQGCCGALTHHMGKTQESHATAAKKYPCVAPRDAKWRPRCHRHQYFWLRNDRQGLRPYVPQ